ncbi:hypothetical protein V6N11_038555 [Hibiscus sabdariffa]|uniref:Uncharacterized protein n=1 Tax=Hibiscus sabdariffa TaxID=183260 RepID=A0ABR2SKL6_9ROSI
MPCCLFAGSTGPVCWFWRMSGLIFARMSGNRPSHVKHPSVLQFFPGTLYFVFSPPSQISRNWQGCYEIKRSHIIHDAGIKDLTLQVEGVEQYGCTTENILRVLQGQRICTLFHRDAHLWEPTKEVGACEMAVAARDSLERLQVSNLAKSIRVLANMEDTWLFGRLPKQVQLAHQWALIPMCSDQVSHLGRLLDGAVENRPNWSIL